MRCRKIETLKNSPAGHSRRANPISDFGSAPLPLQRLPRRTCSSAQPAVNRKRVAGDERCVVGGEKQDRTRDLIQPAHPAQRMQPMKLFTYFLGGAERARNQWSIDHSWADAVDPDS